MVIVAAESEYHPVREYLDSLVWDKVPRIRGALHHFLGADESDYTYECLKLFMLGPISRIFDPGCKFEYMLCLVGGQGAGKSTFVRFMAIFDQWFTDDIKKLDDDKVYEHLEGHWICEIADGRLQKGAGSHLEKGSPLSSANDEPAYDSDDDNRS